VRTSRDTRYMTRNARRRSPAVHTYHGMVKTTRDGNTSQLSALELSKLKELMQSFSLGKQVKVTLSRSFRRLLLLISPILPCMINRHLNANNLSHNAGNTRAFIMRAALSFPKAAREVAPFDETAAATLPTVTVTVTVTAAAALVRPESLSGAPSGSARD